MIEKFIGEAKGIFNTITIVALIMGVIYFLIGLVFFTSPNLSNVLVSIVTGILLIANGVLSIISYFKREGIDLYNYNLVYGLIIIIIGVVGMFLGKVLAIILGLYYLISGFQKISYSLFLKKFHEGSWLTILITGVLFIILGGTAFFTNSDAVITVSGICLMGYGIMNIVDTILLRRRSKLFIA